MKNCLHCNQPVVEGEKFCCIGCKSANFLIKKLNLKDYYEYCRNIYNTSPPRVLEFENKINFIEEVITIKQGSFAINLLVDGIVCGSCVWLIENSLKSLKYITSVKFSLSTKRLEVI